MAPDALGLWLRLSTERQVLLNTRGLMAIKMRIPSGEQQDYFIWHVRPSQEAELEGAEWYIDGSLFDEKLDFSRRCGFGIVVVAADGQLLGYGSGVPPAWIHDAAGAELWAFYVVIREAPGMPRTFTDCQGILDGLAATPARLVDQHSKLARTWAMILQAVEDSADKVKEQVTWVPAHVTASRMMALPPNTSAGTPMTWRQWRANRLVDMVAKAAAEQTRLPPEANELMRKADALNTHAAAVLGAVTYAANNLERVTELPGGGQLTIIFRDSCGERPRKPRTWKRAAPKQEANQQCKAATPSLTLCQAGPIAELGAISRLEPREKRRKLAEAHDQLERVKAAKRVAAHLEGLEQRPAAAAATAADRIAALRTRVMAKQKAYHDWLQEQKEAAMWPD